MVVNFNISEVFDDITLSLSDQIAIVEQLSKNRVKEYSFSQLRDASDRYAQTLLDEGFKENDLVFLAVRPGFDFIALTYSLFKAGIVPLFIDPGVGKTNLLDSIRKIAPDGLIGINKAVLASYIYRKDFQSVKRIVKVERGLPLPGIPIKRLRKSRSLKHDSAFKKESDKAAILFTTGSTGSPKAVVYTHKIFRSQLELIKNHYKIGKEDIDLPIFPLFALFSICLGAKVVIPRIDFTAPSLADPKSLIDLINRYKVTYSFGSPAIWIKIARYGFENNIKLLTLRKVLMAGAPVPYEIHEKLLKIMKEGASTNTPFGATESLPVADIEGKEILSEKLFERIAEGVAVGKPLPGIKIAIKQISDEIVKHFEDLADLSVNQPGEIFVTGDLVSKEYYLNSYANSLHKVKDINGDIWHRMGDIGKLDETGRLWFAGRKSHRVILKDKTLFTIPTEGIYNRHQKINRTALVGIDLNDEKVAVIVIELIKPLNAREKIDIANELYELGKKRSLSDDIRRFIFYDKIFPTDIRHNAKISREKLAIFASDNRSKIISF